MSVSYLTTPAFKQRSVMPPADVDALAQLRWSKVLADVLPASLQEETQFGDAQQVPATGSALAVLFTPTADLVADAANYAILTVSRRSRGSAPVVVASAQTTPGGTGSWIAGVPVALTISAPALVAEDILTISIGKHGTGVIVPTGVLSVLPSPSFVDITLADWTSEINARLSKRYAVPFTAPVPAVVLRWLTKLATRDCYARRGFNPGASNDKDSILDAATTTLAEIKEAAEAVTGLFDLPILDDDKASGIAKGGPLVYAEQSPYTAFDLQRDAGRAEDGRR